MRCSIHSDQGVFDKMVKVLIRQVSKLSLATGLFAGHNRLNRESVCLLFALSVMCRVPITVDDAVYIHVYSSLVIANTCWVIPSKCQKPVKETGNTLPVSNEPV